MSTSRADLKGLGSFVRQQRVALGLTQSDLGKRIGYYQERISAIERGTYGLPSLPALQELAGALEVDLADLLGAAGYTMVPVTEHEEHGGGGGHLNQETRRLAQGVDDLYRHVTSMQRQVGEVERLRLEMRQRRAEFDRRAGQCRQLLIAPEELQRSDALEGV